jgi:hypothetical protein
MECCVPPVALVEIIMKKSVLLMAVLATVFVSQGALARGHSHVGVVLDVPLYPGYYPGPYYQPYYPSPYYSPPMVVVPSSPPVYVQQPAAVMPAPAVQAVPQENYWYYCTKAKGYYPYVTSCPGGWTKVSPQPAGQ